MCIPVNIAQSIISIPFHVVITSQKIISKSVVVSIEIELTSSSNVSFYTLKANLNPVSNV